MRMEARKAEIVFKSNLLATPYIASEIDAYGLSVTENVLRNYVHIYVVIKTGKTVDSKRTYLNNGGACIFPRK